ncbi:MAG: 2-amino-4-hydroxy-6-hydroxymethyldihydropteridine diphosphokinase [Puniceicoccales bacterium]|jgi:2-amino-4-hydroxy-6-hydroxymethyldihydropteridine diphosphokinase|nr:2-amino-4-hydroxy-6-hydroxymethyldihydropteridine diphosphokinase [Puniceicoccales bacterium]
MKNEAYLSLGSNLADRLKFLQMAVAELALENLRIERCSSIYETDPQDLKEQPKFLNCALLVTTDMDVFQLLAACQRVEKSIGKNKTIASGPRNIDIDILTFCGSEICTDELTVPHPRMHLRNFVLIPLREIAPGIKIHSKQIDDLIEKCADQGVFSFSGGTLAV